MGFWHKNKCNIQEIMTSDNMFTDNILLVFSTGVNLGSNVMLSLWKNDCKITLNIQTFSSHPVSCRNQYVFFVSIVRKKFSKMYTCINYMTA